MGNPTLDYGSMYDLMKGSMTFGSIRIDYDLTEGKTREQFAEERRREIEGTICLPSGRIIMPKLGII